MGTELNSLVEAAMEISAKRMCVLVIKSLQNKLVMV